MCVSQFALRSDIALSDRISEGTLYNSLFCLCWSVHNIYICVFVCVCVCVWVCVCLCVCVYDACVCALVLSCNYLLLHLTAAALVEGLPHLGTFLSGWKQHPVHSEVSSLRARVMATVAEPGTAQLWVSLLALRSMLRRVVV